jgi:7-carboxy-7-deazaguanine synthase
MSMNQLPPSIVKQIIKSNPADKREVPEGSDFLNISEFFCDSLQGENFIGWPASFLRLQHCTLNCIWCDTKSVWRYGNPYTFSELFQLMEDSRFDLIRKFREGQHLVLTGGSPIKQQKILVKFFNAFQARYGFVPYLEIENECTLMPDPELVHMIRLWNNSPKLSHSGNPRPLRYKPEIIRFLSGLDNAWFKFVISEESDWQEIETDFLAEGLFRKSQVVLMPLAGSRDELHKNREMVLEMAIKNNVRYSSREHVELWDIVTGA